MTTQEAIKFFEDCKFHCDNKEPINIAISALKTMSATVIRTKILLKPSDMKRLKCELKEQMETGIVAENNIFDVLILDERVKEIQSEAVSKFAEWLVDSKFHSICNQGFLYGESYAPNWDFPCVSVDEILAEYEKEQKEGAENG